VPVEQLIGVAFSSASRSSFAQSLPDARRRLRLLLWRHAGQQCLCWYLKPQPDSRKDSPEDFTLGSCLPCWLVLFL
jgi:hypothetical protein